MVDVKVAQMKEMNALLSPSRNLRLWILLLDTSVMTPSVSWETKKQSGWPLAAPCQGRISQECGHIRSHCYSPASPALPCRCARGEKAEDGREGGGRTRTGGDTQEDRRRCEDLICFSGIKNTHLIIISLLLPITAFSTLTTAYVGRLSTPS